MGRKVFVVWVCCFYMKYFIFSLIVLVGLLNLISATTFDIGSDDNNLTTFTFNSLTEKIEIKGNGVLITNLFHFNIDVDALNQNLHFSLDLPFDDGRNLSISSFEYLACGSQLARENSIEISYPENPEWTLNCGVYESEVISRNSITHISNSIYLSGVPLGDHEKEMGRVGIYVQTKYFLQNYIIENEGEYEYIPIDRFQTSKTYVNFDGGNNKIILVMPEGTILEEKSNFNLKKVGENGEIVLEYRSPKEDSFITFRDSNKQESLRFLRDIFIIAITFAVSSFLIPLTRQYDKKNELWRLLFLFLGFSIFLCGFLGLQGRIGLALLFFLLASFFGLILYADFMFEVIVKVIDSLRDKNSKKS